jgi:hypothetical protein
MISSPAAAGYPHLDCTSGVRTATDALAFGMFGRRLLLRLETMLISVLAERTGSCQAGGSAGRQPVW